MAHVRDLWFKTTTLPDGSIHREPTKRHGKGKRWLAAWTNPEGREQTKAFAKKVEAERHGSLMEADKARGRYLDPNGAKTRLVVFAENWLNSQSADPSTRQIRRIYWDKHIKPKFGNREIGAIRPSEIRTWVNQLEKKLAPSTAGRVLAFLDQLFESAVDDELIAKNPCAAKTVQKPKLPKRKIEPWSTDRVLAVIEALPERYAIMALLGAGCGLRQGEIFGIAVDDVDFEARVIHVRQQVKMLSAKLLFGLPKHDRERTIPLPQSVARALEEYLAKFPAREVTLPWEELDGRPRTLRLIVTSRESKALNRNYINEYVWKPALVRVGVIPKDRPAPIPGRRNQEYRKHGMHALRHHYASVLLHAGESIKALAEYLGHQDPGYTLRTYTHLMAGSEDRTRRAIDTAFGGVDQSHGKGFRRVLFTWSGRQKAVGRAAL
ncbi:tyrosine-type recombinase/integrase [Nonomuraea gerenzanensis]|uniref:tyrosine-type recombinase/integrase n=1 Tax=Nonomuraea gerenzanensis TaxID=93944 RepID=UPI001CD9A7F9|nr:site-specific integrase [Nonomuraea gerenzanensis]UBU16588.1 site-specific integrase [Nonomuraea gerenzanensis]